MIFLVFAITFLDPPVAVVVTKNCKMMIYYHTIISKNIHTMAWIDYELSSDDQRLQEALTYKYKHLHMQVLEN
jgi:hypothetical protein